MVREVSCLGRCDRAPAAAVGHLPVDPTNPERLAQQLASGTRQASEREARAWPAVDPYQDATLPPYSVIRSALEARGIEYGYLDLADFKIEQINFLDPCGVKIEINAHTS